MASPKLVINLQTLINNAFDNRDIRKGVREVMRNNRAAREFGLRIIDRIKERTQDLNIDKNGKAFRGYAESYIKSPVFSIYGKSKDDVDLTLTSEMLSSLDVVGVSNLGPVISFVSEAQGKKAQGHIEGIPRYFGKVKGRVKRDFFGLPEKDQVDILKSVVRDALSGDFDFSVSDVQIEI